MNLLLEKREHIIREQNTAQVEFTYLLNKMTPGSVIEISQPLRGNLDLSILKTSGWKNVKKIVFTEGELTNLSNIPDGLETLHCSKQLLIELENLPKSLIELECNLNYLKYISLKHLTHLKKLSITDNQLTELEDLPDELEELYCQNNQIGLLDFIDTKKLRILNVSNNRTIILKNIPPSIVDFQSENNPYIEYNYQEEKKKNKTTEDQVEQKKNYLDALNLYFQMKRNYETKVADGKRNVYLKNKEKLKSNIKINSKKKMTEFIPKCINCKQPGGTIFKTTKNTHYASCGNVKKPCHLKIEIYNGSYLNIYDTLKIEEEQMDKNKMNIICEKMNTLFQYTSTEESIKHFKKALEEYTFDSKEYEELLEKYRLIYHDKVREEKIVKKNIEIYDLIRAIRELINEYKKNPNNELLKNAVKIQIEELNPEIHNLRMLKYEIMEMMMEDNQSKSNIGLPNMNQTARGEPDNLGTGKAGKKGTTMEEERDYHQLYVLTQKYSGLNKIEYLLGQEPYVKHFVK
jgi:tetratricopeptide (TPR) repeat protein